MAWIETLIEMVMNFVCKSHPWLVFDSVLSTLYHMTKMPKLTLIVWLVTLCGAFAYFEGFMNYWYWQPFWTAPMLGLIYAADCFFAIVRTGRVKGKNFEFQSTRFQKFAVDLVGVMILLGMLHAFPVIGRRMMEWGGSPQEKVELVYETLIMGTWAAYFAIATRQALSAVGNAAKAGVIPKGAAKVLSRHIDSYKKGVFDDE